MRDCPLQSLKMKEGEKDPDKHIKTMSMSENLSATRACAIH